MWKIRKLTNTRGVVLSISGSINSEELPGLHEAVSSEALPDRKVALDLENVRLVDQHVVTYLACCESDGTRLRNCPSYIREWIDREKSALNDKRQ
jgi:ABC-type transporter Mla MlaB component